MRSRLRTAAVHPTCATRHLGLTAKLERLAGAAGRRRRRAARRDVLRLRRATAGSCTRSCPLAATADEAAELRGRDFDAHLCSNRTCEIGLRRGTGRHVRVVLVRARAGDAARRYQALGNPSPFP